MQWNLDCRSSVGSVRRKIGLNFVTENFTTFFTGRTSICHLELTLGGFSRTNLFAFHYNCESEKKRFSFEIDSV